MANFVWTDPEGETEVENSDIEDITNLDANLLFYK